MDEAAVALLFHHPEGRLTDVERPLEVHGDNRVQVGRVELGEALVAKNASVVDDDVDGPVGVQRGLHDGRAPLRRGYRLVVGDGLATRLDDLLDHLLGWAVASASPVGIPPQVVDHDPRSPLR